MTRITVFDTTLRDGEQSPGATMTPPEKLRMAHQLDELGVDVLEAGFPVASLDDFASVRDIARAVRRPVVAALSRARDEDIDRAAAALEGAARPRIHTFIATSDIHLERKLRISRAECLERTARAVQRARVYADDVEFSAEDAMRTDPAFLLEVVRVAVDHGATTINIPDTVGYALPDEVRTTFAGLRSAIAEFGAGACLSVHCHDDLGLAVANSLAAIEGGATQVECTVNGIGERAGNAALEEIAVALVVRADRMAYRTGIRAQALHPTSRLLTELTGIQPQPNKAVVGDNAFAHEAGIHQHGMLRDRSTYEILTPESVGAPGTRLVLGKHSGRHALRHRYQELGYHPDDAALERAYQYCTLLAEQKVPVRDEDLVSVYHRSALEPDAEPVRIEHIEVDTGHGRSSARVRMSRGKGATQEARGTGKEPLAALFEAMQQLVDASVEVEDVSIRAASPTRDPISEVHVGCRVDGRTFTAGGASPDLFEAAARAYLSVVAKAGYALRLEAAEMDKHADQWAV